MVAAIQIHQKIVKGSRELRKHGLLIPLQGESFHIRVSPRDDAVAFFEHPLRHDDAGRLALVYTTGAHRFLTDVWSSASGLAWHPASGEIWFTASRKPDARSLLAVTRTGRVRLISEVPGTVTLRDIDPDGRLLISRDSRRLEMAASLPGDSQERDISWLDWSRAVDISADGSQILFDESGTAATGPAENKGDLRP